MSITPWTLIWSTVAILLLVFLVSLEVYLQSSHPETKHYLAAPLSDHQLSQTSYDLSLSWTHNLPPAPPHPTIHVVVGGSGSLGSAVSRILVERGLRTRIVDIQVSPSTTLQPSFVAWCIANLSSFSDLFGVSPLQR